MKFCRQEYWNGLPFPVVGDLPSPGTEPAFHVSPALQAGSLPLVPPEKPGENEEQPWVNGRRLRSSRRRALCSSTCAHILSSEQLDGMHFYPHVTGEDPGVQSALPSITWLGSSRLESQTRLCLQSDSWGVCCVLVRRRLPPPLPCTHHQSLYMQTTAFQHCWDSNLTSEILHS